MNRRTLLLSPVALAAQQKPDGLAELMNRVAEKWNELVVDMRRGIFDRKKALEVSRRFSNLERSGYWPR